MSRPFNPDLSKYWKICLPATLAGTVELYLFDPIHKKPQYGARAKLIKQLLEAWVEEQKKSLTDAASTLQTTASSMPVLRGYEYELARLKNADGTYSGWRKEFSPTPPNVPEGAVRNMIKLYHIPEPANVSQEHVSNRSRM